MKKIISVLLVLLLILLIPMNSFAQGMEDDLNQFGSRVGEIVDIDGYQFVFTEHSIDTAVLDYLDTSDGYKYSIILDKIEHEVFIQKSPETLARSSRAMVSEGLYKISDSEYDPNDGYSKMVLEDTETSKEYYYDFNSLIQPAAAWALPIGIPLLEKAVEALMAALLATVIGGVAYIVADELALTINKSSYDYFDAYIWNNDVVVGNGLGKNAAKSVVALNSSTHGVFCKNYVKADILAHSWGGATDPERHGSGRIGYYWHYHAFKYPKSHIWYW